MPHFDFSNEKLSVKELSIHNILSSISELVLWRYYLNIDFKFGVPIKAPYRNDNNPSFSIYIDSYGRIKAKDFAGYFNGDIFDYLGKIYNIGLFEVCKKIDYDFNLNLDYPDKLFYKPVYSKKTLSTKEIKKLKDKIEKDIDLNQIQIVIRKYEESDLNYWKTYGITKKTLDLYNVYCVNKVYCNKKLCYIYDSANPGYAYYFPVSGHVKIYYPYKEFYRFMGNVNNYQDIQGYYQCRVKEKENNKLLVLTKSLKDVMLLREFGIDSMAIHGEAHKFHKDFIRHLKKYYSSIISLYDKDKSGINGARYLWKEFKIPAIFINKKYKCKDISDLYLLYGEEIVKIFLITNKLI